MSVEATQWRFVGRQTVTSANYSTIMDAIFTLGTSSTYWDSTARTPGSGSAGTWSRFQNAGVTEAVYCTPAVSPLNHRIIFASRSATPTPSPTMASPDTFLANVLMVNLIKNAGAFNSWNASSPFTSGQTFGYWRLAGTAQTSLTGTVNMWESRDCVAISILSTNQSATVVNQYAFAGALFDPESTDTVSDCETDGKLYGIISGGNSSDPFITTGLTKWLERFDYSSGGELAGLSHITSNGLSHAGVFTPNASTIIPIYRTDMIVPGLSAAQYTRGGRMVRRPINYVSSSNFIGRLRDVYYFPDSRIPRRFLVSSVPVGYVFGPGDIADSNCVLLEH